MSEARLPEESPPPIGEAEVRARQIAAMYHLSRTTRYFPIALIAALLAVFGTDRPLWPLALMAALYIGSTWVFDRLRAGYAKAAPGPGDAERWGRYFAIASIFSGAVWGLAGWFYFTPEQPLALSFLMVLLFGVAASSVVSRAGYLPAFYTYAVVVVGPYVLRAGLYPEPTVASHGLLGLLLFMGIAVWAHASSRRLRVDEAVREQNTLLIARLRGAAQEAETARVAAEAAGRTKSEFLATISHELRTPLNGIIGMVGLLQASRLEPQQRAFADAIHRSGESLLSIINDILDFSRLEADEVVLEKIDFDLREAVGSVVELIAPRAHAKGLELDYYVGPDVPDVLLGDPARLRQILMNLVGNAVKFTAQGTVTLEVLRVGERTGGLLLRFEVVDTGPGVPEDVMPHLFTRFRQGDASITRRFGGTGLGLAIAKRLVEAMAGQIDVENLETAGCRFWFTVPFHEVAVAMRPAPPLEGMRVAVVSDDPARGLMERKLRDLGADALPMAADAEAIAILQPNAVVFDVADDGRAATHEAAQLRRRAAGVRLVLAVRSGLAGTVPPQPDPFDIRLLKPFGRGALIGAILPAETAARIVSASGAATGGRLRLLAVDDIEVNRELLATLLRGYGHEVDTATNGQTALERAQTGIYDAIFMDIEMPVLHGLAAAVAIRRLPGAAGRVPIIGVTAHLDADLVDRSRAAGMDDLLIKPISSELLEQVLARWRRPDSVLPEAAASGVPSGGAVLNERTLDGLELRLGRAKAASLVGDFLADLRRRMDRLLPLAEAAEWEAIRREGHVLKGLAGNFGLPRLTELGDQLIQSARATNGRAAQELARLAVAASYDAIERLESRYPEIRGRIVSPDE